ncbi:MAG: 50S ribosomal protein L21 [Phycisphaeraceae bacterium]|nr:50S ribosomal protein L21 [Phycisphaeraceae bacterium]
MYAIIQDSGTQIKVEEGDVIRVAHRDLDPETATITFDSVLMVGQQEGSDPKIGSPLVDGASVTADILSTDESEKYTIVKFKRRKTYKRKNGHRQGFLRVKITSIQA